MSRRRAKVTVSKRLVVEALEARRVLAVTIDLADILPANGGDGSIGYALVGEPADPGGRELQGYRVNSVAPAGDLNADGYDDVVLGAMENNRRLGAAVVLMGGPTASQPALLTHQSLEDGYGYVVTGSPTGNQGLRWGIGTSVAGNIDVDGDGSLDLLFAGYKDDNLDNIGWTGALLGPTQDWDQVEDVVSVGGAADLISPVSSKFYSHSEYSDDVMTADINGDGYQDVVSSIAASWEGERVGRVGVRFGSANGLQGGFLIRGGYNANRIGIDTASIGDVNGDGRDDLMIVQAENAIVVFGAPDWVNGREYLIEAIDSPGTTFELPQDETDYGFGFKRGFRTAGVGDVNGDGLDDFALSMFAGDGVSDSIGNSGNTYVVFGRTNWSNQIDLEELDGTDGFTVYGVNWNDESGTALGGGGDFNGDGFDDVLIGAPRADGPTIFNPGGPGERGGAGDSYVIFGKANWMNDAHVEVATLADNAGVILHGAEIHGWSGRAIDFAGDMNGDGFDDVVVAAPGIPLNQPAAMERTDSGSTFVVYGFGAGGPGSGGSGNTSGGNTSGGNMGGGNAAAGWQNALEFTDVDADGIVSPLDALFVINELVTPQYTNAAGTLLSATRPSTAGYLDVDGNGIVAPLDALLVVNALLASVPQAAASSSVDVSVSQTVDDVEEEESEALIDQVLAPNW